MIVEAIIANYRRPINMPPASTVGRIGTPRQPIRCAILISGSGSGMQAMLTHQQTTNCSHITSVVISNKADVLGIDKALALNTPVEVIELPAILDKDERRHQHELMIDETLHNYQVELIILSGYMRLLSKDFIDKWQGQIINIHPSLLPDFPGANAHRDVISAGVKKSGCTVHYVDSGMDTGEIIAQCEVDVLPEDTEETLSNKVKTFEHILYPLVIDAVATNDFSNLSFD